MDILSQSCLIYTCVWRSCLTGRVPIRLDVQMQHEFASIRGQ